MVWKRDERNLQGKKKVADAPGLNVCPEAIYTNLHIYCTRLRARTKNFQSGYGPQPMFVSGNLRKESRDREVYDLSRTLRRES